MVTHIFFILYGTKGPEWRKGKTNGNYFCCFVFIIGSLLLSQLFYRWWIVSERGLASWNGCSLCVCRYKLFKDSGFCCAGSIHFTALIRQFRPENAFWVVVWCKEKSDRSNERCFFCDTICSCDCITSWNRIRCITGNEYSFV